MGTTRTPARNGGPCRKAIRVRFRYDDGHFEFIGYRRVQATSPPVVGERPDPETASGFWVEVRDKRDKPLYFKVLQGQFNSVEVANRDGTIERRFADAVRRDFHVLLPDLDEARQIVLLGDTGKRKNKGPCSSEIARFEVPSGEQGETS